MKPLVPILGSILFLAVAAFCVFGFMAIFEPTDSTDQCTVFRIGYAVVGVGSLIGVKLLIIHVACKQVPSRAR